MKLLELRPTATKKSKLLGLVKEQPDIGLVVLAAGEASNEIKHESPKGPDRLVSLDAFRGLTVLIMLIVNNIALDNFTPDSFTHAAWNQGLRLADFVFPWFLLCVGLSIPYSFASFAKKGLPNWRYELKILSRASVLMLLGCLVNCAFERKLFFSLGVLQLIAMAYLVAAYAYELPPIRRAVIASMMLIGYGMAILFLPIPGAHIGSFSEDANFFGNINKTYLQIYNIDGLFSTVPTAALMIFATLVSDALMSKKLNHSGKLSILCAVGAVMTLLGIWCNTWIPYNKPVWTPSYILLTGGVGLLAVAVLYLLTDAVKWTKWPSPLLVLGANALLAYALPVFFKLTILDVRTVQTPNGNIPIRQEIIDSLVYHLGRVAGGWTYTCLYIVCWWLVLLFMYRRQAFLRV